MVKQNSSKRKNNGGSTKSKKQKHSQSSDVTSNSSIDDNSITSNIIATSTTTDSTCATECTIANVAPITASDNSIHIASTTGIVVSTTTNTESTHVESTTCVTISTTENTNPIEVDKTSSDSNQMKQKVYSFMNEGWSVVTDSNITPKVSNNPCLINTDIVKSRQWKRNLQLFISSFFPVSLFQQLADIINRNMVEKFTTQVGKTNSKYYSKLVSVGEVINFYYIIIELENKWAPLATDKQSNFREINAASLIMGENRFKAIQSCLIPDTQEFELIVQTLNEVFAKHVVPGETNAFDETVYSYQVSSKKKEKLELVDPVPKVFIPRKPHPNGLLTYKLCGELSKKATYTIVLVPHFQFPQITPTNAMRKAISIFKNYFPSTKLHVVADSAFGSLQELEILTNSDTLATFSMCSTERSWLWELLRRTKLDHWNGATLSNGSLVSIEVGRGDNNQLRFHHLATNAFNVMSTTISEEVNEIVGEDDNQLNLEPNSIENSASQFLENDSQVNTSQPEDNTLQSQNNASQSQVNNSQSQINDSQDNPTSSTTYSMEQLMQYNVKKLKEICVMHKLKVGGKKQDLVNRIKQAQEKPSTQNTPPCSFTKESLASHTVSQLKEICTNLHLRARGKKSDIIDLILKVSSSSTTISKQLDLIEETNHSKASGLHHNTYRDNFNFVDKNNKEWYRCYYRYAINNWRSKMLISLLEEVSLNMYALCNELETTSFADFRLELAKAFDQFRSKKFP